MPLLTSEVLKYLRYLPLTQKSILELKQRVCYMSGIGLWGWYIE